MANLKNTNIDNNLELPQGTTAQRPASPQEGQIRYNTDLAVTEFYNGTNWRPLSDTHPEATGGTVVDTDIGGVPYRIHFYRNVGTENFSVTNPGAVDILVVGAGGAGGSDNSGSDSAGGGGGGGIVFQHSLFLATGNYSVTVGNGGAGVLEGGNPVGDGERGEDTVFSGPSASITAFGGGGGLRGDPGGQAPTYPTYGAGGGGGTRGSLGAPATSQGNAGGDSQNPGGFDGLLAGGGGGGSTETEADISGGQGGNYGFWFTTNFGENGIFAGGGGGGSSARSQGGDGGPGGGGYGHLTTSAPGEPGIDSTGGGGGASDGGFPGGNGGSGIVIIRYPRNSTTTTQPDRTTIATQPNRFQTVRDGLVLELDAGNPVSYPGTGSNLLDIAGSNTFTIEGADFEAPNYFNFDGSNDRIGNSSFFLNSDPLVSVVMWIRRTDNFSSGGYWGLGGASANNGINSYTSPSRPNKIGWDLWGRTTFDTGQDYPFNQWVHIVWVKFGTTFTTSTLTVYINGVEFPLVFTSRNNSSSVNLNTGFAIGNISTNLTNYYAPGDIGQTLVYNRALSDQEVRHNFNVTRGQYGI